MYACVRVCVRACMSACLRADVRKGVCVRVKVVGERVCAGLPLFVFVYSFCLNKFDIMVTKANCCQTVHTGLTKGLTCLFHIQCSHV